MVEVAVPNDFMCPISLELMRDPVTLSTGQTYDRTSIERWFQRGHNTCPSTMQVVNRMDVAPNQSLQRLIKQWCSSNDFGHGVAVQQPSVREVELRVVKLMLQQVAQGTDSFSNLKKLRTLAKECNPHEIRTVLREAGAIPILANFAFCPENLGKDSIEACEEALGILTFLPLQNIRKAVQIGSKQLTAISWLLNRGILDARTNAALVLGSIAHDDNEMKLLIGATAGVFQGLVQLLKEDLYPRAMEASLRAITTIISGLEKNDVNKVKAVAAGVVFATAELLPEAERRGQERPLTKLLDLLCSCPEGLEAVSTHALVVPMLVRIISLRDSVASENAVSCLWTVCENSRSKCIDEAAGQAGVMTQLSLLVHADDGRTSPITKMRAADLLRRIRDRLKHCDDRC